MAKTPRIKTRVQTRFLQSDFAANGVMTDLTFDNLEAGKIYRVKFHQYRLGSSSSYQVTVQNESQLLGVFDDPPDNTAQFRRNKVFDRTFTAEAGTVTFTTSSHDPGESYQGNGTASETYVTLEELNSYEETTDFTP